MNSRVLTKNIHQPQKLPRDVICTRARKNDSLSVNSLSRQNQRDSHDRNRLICRTPLNGLGFDTAHSTVSVIFHGLKWKARMSHRQMLLFRVPVRPEIRVDSLFLPLRNRATHRRSKRIVYDNFDWFDITKITSHHIFSDKCCAVYRGTERFLSYGLWADLWYAIFMVLSEWNRPIVMESDKWSNC